MNESNGADVQTNDNQKLWGGRFQGKTNSILEKLNSSIGLDKRMYSEDIDGSKAYAKSLQHIKLLTQEECEEIWRGLETIRLEWDANSFVIKNDEDIHSANERRLKELIGDAASKLHTGRSRNDQVATDMKLWLKKSLETLDYEIKRLVGVIVMKAANEIDVLMPGYTHLQRAQPVRFSHWMLSHGWNFKNDCDKLKYLLKNIDYLPLGSGALAGNPFNIDRNVLANDLNFSNTTQNSMQAVGDRDFVAEFLFWASLFGVHLSKLAEDLIIYSSKEFNFIIIDDAFSTGSSLMPQKRNPDSLELIRSIGGSLFGQCCTFMMTIKSLPSTYNKDLQCDKECMFATFDKLKILIEVTAGTLETMKIDFAKCNESLSYEMLATDLAYYLVRKGIPFRTAHHLAGEVVAEAERKNVFIFDLTLEELKHISSHFDADVAKVWNYENSVEQYEAIGGTSRNSVNNQIKLLEIWIESSNKIVL